MLKRIGRYINLQPLDTQGGMGQVFLAEHELLPDTFVVKIPNPLMQADPEALERFKRECIIMSRIQHPNIVHCLEPGEENGTWYLPMEWVRGEPLQTKIENLAAIPLQDRIGWSKQILSGLEAAHAARPRPVIHRDLKPSNIMVTPEGVVKILDFGIAHEAGSNLTRAGNPGTIEFQAPEQVLNGPIDARTDLFSLGIVLYMLFTGRHPFKSEREQSNYQIQNAILNEDPPALTEVDPRLAPGLNVVVLRALKKKPEDRFPSAAEMRRALEDLSGGDEDAVVEAANFARKQLERAARLLDAGGAENVDAAAKFVKTAIALLPNDTQALLLEERVKAMRSEIERIELLFAKASRAVEERRFAEARSCLDLALSIKPNDSRLRRLQADLEASERAAGVGASGGAAAGAGAAAGSASAAAGATGGTAAGVRGGATGAAAARGDARQGEVARRQDARLQEAMELVRRGDREGAARIVDDLLLESPGDLWVLAAACEAGLEPRPRWFRIERWPLGLEATAPEAPGRADAPGRLEPGPRRAEAPRLSDAATGPARPPGAPPDLLRAWES